MNILETVIESHNVTLLSPNNYCAEASSLGLKPGEWPQAIRTTLGNCTQFVAQRRHFNEGDLLSVDYVQTGLQPAQLTIFND